jgi:hypothetical protein
MHCPAFDSAGCATTTSASPRAARALFPPRHGHTDPEKAQLQEPRAGRDGRACARARAGADADADARCAGQEAARTDAAQGAQAALVDSRPGSGRG